MQGSILENVFLLADEVSKTAGCDVIDAEFKKEGSQMVLRIYIDKKGGIGIDECEKFSRLFEEKIDEKQLIEKAYVLEVSSPGVDRKLKTKREFLYYIGREVLVKLYKAIDKQKEFVGILEEFNDNVVTISKEDKKIEFPISEAVYIRLYFKI